MDEYSWLAICFAIFVALTYRIIIKSISSSISDTESYISGTIKDAEKLYLEAKEKHDEARALFSQIEVSKKYILEKEDREIEFDLSVREESLKDAIEVKKMQLQNQMNREIRNLKKYSLEMQTQKLKKRFIAYLEKDKKLAEHYTNLVISKTK
jgi:F0F1-type ATP synthase membrane subunit b/b'